MEANEHTKVPFAEGDVTRLRREFKWVASAVEADALCERLLREGLLQGPPPATQITSIYFDRAGLPLTARAIARPDDCLKIRTKEYFPNRCGQADHLVLEAKRERNGLTRKSRRWLPRAALREALKSGRGLPLGVMDAAALLPVLGVAYERRVFQSAEAWRVTVDCALTFHVVTAEQAFGLEGLRRELLGPPVRTEERVVIEVKHLGNGLPEWLAQLQGRAERFSKFAEGMACLDETRTAGIKGG